MTSLRGTIEQVAARASRGYQRTPDRLTHTERAVATLPVDMGLGQLDEDEERDAFLERVSAVDLKNLSPRDMRWLLRTVWEVAEHPDLANTSLSVALSRRRRTFDQSIIAGYLTHFPTTHPAFDALVAAARVAAERHDWDWRERGRLWSLWEPEEGPRRLGRALVEGDVPPLERLRSAGFDLESASAAFVRASFYRACRTAAGAKKAVAEAQGTRLIGLMDALGGNMAVPPILIYALLSPWRDGNPSDAHRARISRLLSVRAGDPRLDRSRWDNIHTRLEREGLSDVADILAIYRRWVVQAAVRQFFEIVAKSTNDPIQWAQRTQFWLAYLDAGAIEDAWFAFGPRAEASARNLHQRDASLKYGKISTGGGAEGSHSSLILSMGDLRIAEWSHNGACRFWSNSDQRAPQQYQKQYDSGRLKAMSGGQGFTHISHTSNWQGRFARHIYSRTSIQHPVHGRGW
ncbi:MAG TPA: EH signature domain-containing protein [Allosphingosinicella sp.]|nr:EH signature domain-containing protein [Allosphingosinicella sp.]